MFDQNALRKLLEAGILTQDDLQPNELEQMMPQPRYDIAPMQMNSMRVENGPDAGNVTSLNFSGARGPDMAPPVQPEWAQQAQQQFAQAQKPRTMRVVGSGNGTTVDLGEEPAAPVALDITRPAIEVPGVGKAYYSKDGRGAYVMGPDGQPSTKVILGYDMQGSMALNKAAQEQRAQDAQIAHIQEQTAASQQARSVKEDPTSQAYMEKRFGKAPEGTRWRSDGSVEQIPGYDGKPLNESQAKAAGMGARAAAAHFILMGYENDPIQPVTTPGQMKIGAEALPVVGGALGNALNWTQSKEQQAVDQAQRDFINAVLRPESGAVISDSEFANARKQYFPQIGDKAETIAQKQQARERELKTLGVMAGEKGSKVIQAAQSQAPVKTTPVKTNSLESDQLPDARKHRGATMTDKQSGLKYRSNGITWERQ